MRPRSMWRIAAAIVVSAPMVVSAAATPKSGSEDAEIRAYTPTDAKFQGYLAATKAAQDAVARDPSLQAEALQIANEQGSGSLDTLQRIFERHPRYFAFFSHEGLKVRETAILSILIPWMMQYADSNPSQRAVTASMMSKAQIAFADAHMADLNKLLAQFAAQATP